MQFDSRNSYEVVHRFAPVQEVRARAHARDLRPRASTPLLDAIGRGINDLESSLVGLMENYRPSRLVLVAITDGQENASREFRRDQILKMIREKEARCDWQFVFLSADLNAINAALEHGFLPKAAMAFDKTGRGTHTAFSAFSDKVARYRQSVDSELAFTSEDRAQQQAERKRGN